MIQITQIFNQLFLVSLQSYPRNSSKSGHNLLGNQHGDPDCYQNLIICSLYHPGPLHKISLPSIYNFLSNLVNKPMLPKI